MKLIQLTQGKFAKVDDEDFEFLNQFNWYYRSDNRYQGYAVRRLGRGTERMHKVLVPDSKKVDHKNGDKLDNQRHNLRPASSTTNGQNRKLNSNNRAGIKGANYFNGKWQGAIRVNKVKIHLGYFNTPQEAGIAYDTAALKHFGEFARTNQQMGIL